MLCLRVPVPTQLTVAVGQHRHVSRSLWDSRLPILQGPGAAGLPSPHDGLPSQITKGDRSNQKETQVLPAIARLAPVSPCLLRLLTPANTHLCALRRLGTLCGHQSPGPLTTSRPPLNHVHLVFRYQLSPLYRIPSGHRCAKMPPTLNKPRKLPSPTAGTSLSSPFMEKVSEAVTILNVITSVPPIFPETFPQKGVHTPYSHHLLQQDPRDPITKSHSQTVTRAAPCMFFPLPPGHTLPWDTSYPDSHCSILFLHHCSFPGELAQATGTSYVSMSVLRSTHSPHHGRSQTNIRGTIGCPIFIPLFNYTTQTDLVPTTCPTFFCMLDM